MTAYLMTEAQHAQIVDALTHWTTPNWAGACVDQCNEALAILKAMKPQAPSAWLACDKEGNVGCSTKEHHALRCCEAGTKAEPLYKLGDTA